MIIQTLKTTLAYIILQNAPLVHVQNPRKIKRKHGGVVVSEQETKDYNVVFKKRQLMNNFVSVPRGYYLFIFL
jgi:hypothetical protein